jgi:hypothetical protein
VFSKLHLRLIRAYLRLGQSPQLQDFALRPCYPVEFGVAKSLDSRRFGICIWPIWKVGSRKVGSLDLVSGRYVMMSSREARLDEAGSS